MAQSIQLSQASAFCGSLWRAGVSVWSSTDAVGRSEAGPAYISCRIAWSSTVRGSKVQKPEEYQKIVDECLDLWRVVPDADSKMTLLEVAHSWIKLAQHVKAKAEGEKV